MATTIDFPLNQQNSPKINSNDGYSNVYYSEQSHSHQESVAALTQTYQDQIRQISNTNKAEIIIDILDGYNKDQNGEHLSNFKTLKGRKEIFNILKKIASKLYEPESREMTIIDIVFG